MSRNRLVWLTAAVVLAILVAWQAIASAAYDQKARDLAERFKKNFKDFESQVTREVREAGPA